MSIDRELLVQYLRQLGELGVEDVFLDSLTAAEALAMVAGQAAGAAPARPADAGTTARSAKAAAAAAGILPPDAEPARPPRRARDAHGAGVAGVAGVADVARVADIARITHAANGLAPIAAAAAVCTQCRLHAERTTVVFGEGNPHADVVVVGEAPGQEEDRTGRPFVGRAGKLLDLLLMSVGFPRDSVYICNTLKCRPPNNRNPLPDEVAACGGFLQGQLEAIAPKVLLAVGKFAAQALLQSEESIGRLRGVVHEYRGSPLIVTYHPAYLLRSPQMTRIAWQDFQLLRRVLDEQA